LGFFSFVTLPHSISGKPMRRSVTPSLIFVLASLFSSASGAQSPYAAAAGPTREVGLFLSGRVLSTEYSVDDGKTAFGGAVTFGTFLGSMIDVQGGIAINYSRQEYSYYKPPLFTFTPTVSLLIGPSTGDFQPYGLVGAGYEFVRYTHPRCDCAQSRSLGIANVGAGFRKMFGDNKAFRMEVTSQIGSGGPAFTGLAGISFLIRRTDQFAKQRGMTRPRRVKSEPPVIIPKTGVTIQPATPRNMPVTTPPPAPAPSPTRSVTPSRLPTGIGATILTIDGTQVDFAKPTWRDDIETLLDGLVIDLTSDAGMTAKISIEAHTDNVGSKAANIMLGLDRARAVRDYLVTQGIAAERIRISSAGQDSPVASNSTALGRQQNRRIVIKRDN
jgi:outer membrane protein OmpA-like peptidoglycan-associated protein